MKVGFRRLTDFILSIQDAVLPGMMYRLRFRRSVQTLS